jgi:sugar/nucleoside kinase (ribokinase family)
VTIVVVGDLMADVVARHEAPLAYGSDTDASTHLRGGGAGGNVAAWLLHAGADVALVGRVGDDAFAAVALDGLDDRTVERAAGERTGICVVLVDPDGERTMLPDAGANAALAPDDLPAGEVLYLSGYMLLREGSRAAARRVLALARERGMRIALDPASAAPLARAPEFLDWAGPVDVLLANEAEAAVLGGIDGARELIVKRGAHGATWTDGTRTIDVPALPTDVRDTTGAGDAFAAGFLTAWPGPPEPALARATELAALAVSRDGGRP